MIITITCNPAIDKTINENNVSYTIGGKGINVSKCLNVLDTKNIATGFLGKDNGNIILDDLKKTNIQSSFFFVEGKVRTNTKTIIDNKLYENNEEGPIVETKQQLELLEYLKPIKNHVIVISGSVPKGINTDYYRKIIETVKNNSNTVILDASKDLLKEGIKAYPDIIKPNKDEICEYFNIEYDKELVIEKCKELVKKGIKMIVVSLGEEGSLFIFENSVYEVSPMKVNYVSSLCAGDSMVAGIAYSKENGLSNEDMIRLAVACANCSVEEISTFKDRNKVFEYMKKVKIEVLK